MPKYLIELEGRDKDCPLSRCFVRDKSGRVLGTGRAILTEAALLAALREAREGIHSEIWEAVERAEEKAWRECDGKVNL